MRYWRHAPFNGSLTSNPSPASKQHNTTQQHLEETTPSVTADRFTGLPSPSRHLRTSRGKHPSPTACEHHWLVKRARRGGKKEKKEKPLHCFCSAYCSAVKNLLSSIYQSRNFKKKKRKKGAVITLFLMHHKKRRKCDLNTVEGRVRRLAVTQDNSVTT